MKETTRKELEALVPPEPEELVTIRDVMEVIGLRSAGTRTTIVDLAKRHGIPMTRAMMNGRWRIAVTVPNAKRLIEAYYKNRKA